MWILAEQNSIPKLTSPPFVFAIIFLVHFSLSKARHLTTRCCQPQEFKEMEKVEKNPDKLVFENVMYENSVTHSYLVIWDVSLWSCHEQCRSGHLEHVPSHTQALLFLRYISRRIFESNFFFTFSSMR